MVEVTGQQSPVMRSKVHPVEPSASWDAQTLAVDPAASTSAAPQGLVRAKASVSPTRGRVWQLAGQLLLCVTSSLVKRARDRGSHLWGRRKPFHPFHHLFFLLEASQALCFYHVLGPDRGRDSVSPGPALRSSVCREESVWIRHRVMTEDSHVPGGWRSGEPLQRIK